MQMIERLKQRAGVDRKVYKEVMIKGEDFSFWHTPLTIREQTAAQKQAKSDDANDFAIALLIQKALDENGQRIFGADAGPILRNEVEKAEVEKLLLALVSQDEVEEDLDLKSPQDTAKEGKPAAR